MSPRTQNPSVSAIGIILVIHSVPVDDFVFAILLDWNAAELTKATHQCRVSRIKPTFDVTCIKLRL